MAAADVLNRLFLGTTRERWLRASRPKRGALLPQLGTRMGRLSRIGETADGTQVTLSGEERKVHVEILGAPNQGKSKLLELLVRETLPNGYFQCLIDPSDGGATARALLDYCCHIGFERVLWVNPADFDVAVPAFNPIKYRAPTEVVVGNTMDALSVLWQSDFKDKLGFAKFAEVLVNVIHRAGYTLADAEHFLIQSHSRQRDRMLRDIPDDIWRHEITKANKNAASVEGLVNRFMVFSDPKMRLLLGARRGLSFRRLIKEGWLVLLNLDPQLVWGARQTQQRLLGTLIINEIVYAQQNLREFEGFNRPSYIYVDEVGDYATPKISMILNKKRKANLSLTLAHQTFGQVLNREVLAAIRASTSVKVLFHTPDSGDRMVMQKDLGYGGEFNDRELNLYLRGLKVGQAAITVGKAPPRIVDITRVKSKPQHPATLKAYVKRLYSHEFYRRPEEINQEMNDRFNDTNSPGKPGGAHAGRPAGLRPQVARHAAAAHRRADSAAGPGAEARREFKTVFPEEG